VTAAVPDDVPDPRAVLDAFGIPGSAVAIAEVPGAWSNRVFRLSTTDGDYAVKALRNPWGEPRWAQWLAEGWRLELAAASAGVAMPPPVAEPAHGGCVAYVGDGSGDVPVRIHRWVDGVRPGPGAVDPAVASWAGRTLATVHALALQPLDPSLFPTARNATAAAWPGLVERARVADVGWAGPLASARPWVERVSDLVVAADGEATVMCHGDLTAKNILLTTDGPVLCDWDVALPLVPARDLASVAVTLAAWRDRAVARQVVTAYAEAGGAVRSARPEDLGPTLAVRLDWISLCVHRALGLHAVTAEESREADALVPGLLLSLPDQVAVAESLADWLA
jgi:Ser/Thr protein kinase RdoA (MazF antagonist)